MCRSQATWKFNRHRSVCLKLLSIEISLIFCFRSLKLKTYFHFIICNVMSYLLIYWLLRSQQSIVPFIMWVGWVSWIFWMTFFESSSAEFFKVFTINSNILSSLQLFSNEMISHINVLVREPTCWFFDKKLHLYCLLQWYWAFPCIQLHWVDSL